MKTAVRTVGIALITLLLGLSPACGDDTDPQVGSPSFDRCLDSFAQVAARDEPGTDLLFRALRWCDNVADWRVAASRYPKATEGQDALLVLARLCAGQGRQEYAENRLCQDAFLAHPELEPQGL
jgi:hypothetical protein